jgi:hypothetical protein
VIASIGKADVSSQVPASLMRSVGAQQNANCAAVLPYLRQLLPGEPAMLVDPREDS